MSQTSATKVWTNAELDSHETPPTSPMLCDCSICNWFVSCELGSVTLVDFFAHILAKAIRCVVVQVCECNIKEAFCSEVCWEPVFCINATCPLIAGGILCHKNCSSSLVFHPIVGFTKRFEVMSARLDHLVPVRKTFFLGKDQTPWCNFLCGIALSVAEKHELLWGAQSNVDTSTHLAWCRKQGGLEESSWNSFQVRQELRVWHTVVIQHCLPSCGWNFQGCGWFHHSSMKHTKGVFWLQHAAHHCTHMRSITSTVNKHSRLAFSSSAGVKVTMDAVDVLIAELNCDKCQSDKWQFFTVNLTANKLRNATKMTLETKFSTLMFHQQSRCDFTRIWNLWASSQQQKWLHLCRLSPMRLTSHWQDWLHGVHVSSLSDALCCHKSAGMHNIVLEHIMETQLFVPFLYSGFNLVSCSLGCTLVPGLGLNCGWNRAFVMSGSTSVSGKQWGFLVLSLPSFYILPLLS